MRVTESVPVGRSMGNRSYPIIGDCQINGDRFVAIELTESAAKHYCEYFLAKGAANWEQPLEDGESSKQ